MTDISDPLDEVLRRATRAFNAPNPQFSDVVDRARRYRMRRAATGAVVALVLLAAVIYPLARLSGLSSENRTTGDARGPSILTIVCDGGSTEVSSDVVSAQPDGVHVEIRNQSDARATIFLAWGTRDVPPGFSSHVLPLAPGEVVASCDAEASPNAVATVVDPAGYYIRPVLEGCPASVGAQGGHVPVGQSEDDPIQLIRRLPASELSVHVRSDDTYSRVGYLESREEALVLVERSGQPVAILKLVSENSSWQYVGEEYCPS